MTNKHNFDILEIRLVDLLGQRITVVAGDVADHLVHKATMLFYGLCAAVLIATDATEVFLTHPAPTALGYWAVGLICYLALYLPLLLVVGIVQNRIINIVIPMPLLCGITLSATVLTTSTFWHYVTGVPFNVFTPSNLLRLFLTANILETIYVRFVFPQVKEQTDSAKAFAKAQQPRFVAIGKHKMRVDQIQYVAAQEHFIKIQLEDTHILHRARLRDLVAQTEPEDGIQPHRSWWVSRSAKPQLDRHGQRHVLVLEDETVVPVARTRLPDIESWLSSPPEQQH